MTYSNKIDKETVAAYLSALNEVNATSPHMLDLHNKIIESVDLLFELFLTNYDTRAYKELDDFIARLKNIDKDDDQTDYSLTPLTPAQKKGLARIEEKQKIKAKQNRSDNSPFFR